MSILSVCVDGVRAVIAAAAFVSVAFRAGVCAECGA
jgi:hypothetical protein